MKKIVIKKFSNNMRLERSASSVGVFLLLCIYPFVFSRGYKDITYTRFMFFCLVSIITFAICAISFLSKTTSAKSAIKKYFSSATATDKAFLCFFVSTFLAFVFSEYKYAALIGDLGRYMGFLIFFAIFLMYIWVSRFFTLTERTMQLFCITCICIATFSFLQFEGVDLFNFLKSVQFEKRKNFLSPFGNINVFASFLSVATPFSMYMFCFTKDNSKKLFFYGAVCAANFISALTSNSDSVYVMLVTVFTILFILLCKKPDNFVRFFVLCAIFFGSSILFAVVYYIIRGTRGLSTLTDTYVSSRLPFIGMIISVVLHFVFTKHIPSVNILKKVRTATIALVLIGISSIFFAMLYFSIYDTSTDLGIFNSYLRFNDSWGTDRGYVWSRLIRAFRNASFKEKLFGFGEDTVSVVLIERYLSEMRTKLGYLFDNAHNEYLHYLITTGLFGLGSYLSILLSTLLSYKNGKMDILQKALILSVAGYMVQSGFNIIQPISTPFIFIAAALIRCRCEDINSTKINTKNALYQTKKGGNET